MKYITPSGLCKYKTVCTKTNSGKMERSSVLHLQLTVATLCYLVP